MNLTKQNESYWVHRGLEKITQQCTIILVFTWSMSDNAVTEVLSIGLPYTTFIIIVPLRRFPFPFGGLPYMPTPASISPAWFEGWIRNPLLSVLYWMSCYSPFTVGTPCVMSIQRCLTLCFAVPCLQCASFKIDNYDFCYRWGFRKDLYLLQILRRFSLLALIPLRIVQDN